MTMYFTLEKIFFQKLRLDRATFVALDNLKKKNSAKLPSLSLKKHSVERTMLLSYSYKSKYYKNINKRAYLSK